MLERREKPILFSAPMVRAILAGRKTQTRRIVTACSKNQRLWLSAETINKVRRFEHRKDNWWAMAVGEPSRIVHCGVEIDGGHIGSLPCPYGQPGDRLWVKESYRLRADQDSKKPSDDWWKSGASWYEADGNGEPSGCGGGMGKLRPGIFMPRWASRSTLEVTDVRVERLQELTDADARAEGFPLPEVLPMRVNEKSARGIYFDAKMAFVGTWTALNQKRAPWTSNPWVWVVSFKKLEGE